MKIIRFELFAVLLAAHAHAATTLINFDTAGNWIPSSSGALTSYWTDHIYAESGWRFTGGPALRNTTTAQDGYPGAQGSYAWRLRDATVTWTATYTNALQANAFFSGFGFDVRRWDGSPSPAYAVDYSFNGGATWSPFMTVNNTTLDSVSAWKTFSHAVTSAMGLAANQFVIRFSATGGERIMVDNFTAEISEGTGGGGIAVPTGVSATANGQTALDVIWTLNAAGDPVLVARSANGLTGTPTNGTAYVVGQTIPGGGTVVYAGSATSFADTGLTTGSEYTYTVWSVGASTVYSSGVSDSAVTAGDGTGLRIFHMNDVHSRLTPHDYDVPETNDVPVFEKVGGAAYFGAKMLELKAAYPSALILDAGDSSEGSPLGDLRGNGGLIDFYNLLDTKLKGLGGRGIDAAVVGNHDVRFKAMLDNMKTNAAFPFISMNILDKVTGLPYFKPYVTVIANGQKVGILGYTTDTSAHLGPDTEGLLRVAKCGWDDTKAEIKIKAYVDELRTVKQCDRVVLLIHVGLSRAFSDDQKDDEYQLVKDDGVTAPPEVVVSGHWHGWTPTAWQPSQLNYKTVSVEAASYMQYIGEVHLNTAGRYVNARKHVIRNADITPDADVEALINTLIAEYEAGSPAYALDQVIGYSGVDLRLNKNKWWTHDEYPWAGDNTAGAWISDAMQWYVETQTPHGCDLALQSGGGVRRDNAAGPLTYLEIYETYPWQDDNMVLVEATGREIWEFIENDFVGTSISKGWEVFADDGVITDIKKDGLSIDLDATFNVVISDYMYNYDNDTIVGGWGDASPTLITRSIRQSVIDYTSQFDAAHPMDVAGPRYRLNVGHSGRFQAVVTMVDDIEDQPYYEAVFVRLLSATPDTVARRGGYVDETLVNEDGSINASHEFAEGMLYRSYLGFKDGLLAPGTLLNIQVEAGFHGGNPQWIEQSGILADGVEFDIAGTNVSLATPDYKASISEFWNEEHENRFVKFEAVKVGASQVRDRLGNVITIYAPGAYELLALPGSVGDLLALTGVQTYRYTERRFRCAGAVVLEVAPVEPDYAPYSSVNALTGEILPGYRLTAFASDATQETQATLLSMDDTYVTDGYPTYTNGTKTALYLQSASTTANAYGDERIWTKFDLSSLPAGAAVTSARLRLYCYAESASNSIPANVLACADDSWTEETLKWNTQPSLGTVLDQIILDGDQRYVWYEWDVTSFVAAETAGDGFASLVVKAHADDSPVKQSFTFDAKEFSGGSMGPFLQVNFTGGPVSGGTVTNLTFHYRFSADNRNWNDWAEAGSVSAAPWGIDFPFAEGFGWYEFYSVAVDNTGNVEEKPRLADTRIHYEAATIPTSKGTVILFHF